MMKAKHNVLLRCMAMLLCIVMVAALLPEMEASAALDTPSVSVSLVGGGLKVSWKPITGAEKYRVFRKRTSDTKWIDIKTVDSSVTSYTDTNVGNGCVYTYTVRCVAKDGKTYTSSYDHTGVTRTYWLNATPNVKVANVDNGVKISWGAISGAQLYRVFRKIPGGGWATLGFTAGTSFVDESVSAGNTYTYTVRCTTSDKKSWTSDYNATGVSITFVKSFSISGIESVNGGVKLTWTKTIASTTYTIERSTGQEWRTVGTTTGLTFTNTGADYHLGLSNNTTYQYRVSYTAGGSKVTTPVKTITYFQTPELKSVDVDQGVFTVKWLEVQGVPQYRVFRKLPGDSKWTAIANVTGTSYVDKNVASGLNYFYTVRCINANGSFISGYDNTGLQATYIGIPSLISTAVENDGIHFKWNAVGGVKKYQVYRKTPSSSWEKYDGLQTVTGDVGEYIDKFATSGQTYYYTVACDDGAKQSDYDPNGLACTRRANPVLIKASIETADGLLVSWKAVDGVSKYRVFRKEASGTVWKALGDTSALTYTDKTVVNKGSYVYTVRCLTPDGKHFASGYDTNGVKATYYSIPALISATVTARVDSGTGTIEVKWKTVEGVTKYKVFRRYVKNDGSLSDWVRLTSTATGGVYYDTPSGSGVTYIYTVRCSDGTNSLSFFDRTGVRTYFLKTPELMTPSAATGSITVRWKYVDGAKGYKVYRKVPGAGWTTIATINSPTTLTYKDTYKLVVKQNYVYTVRAINGSNISGYSTVGVTVKAQ